MKYAKVLLVLTALALFFSMGCERTVTNEITKQVTPSTAAYVGSEVCQPCHSSTYDSFRKTGHPYKLNEAADAQQAGYYPFTTLPSPPPGVAWSDVDKVIGGFWWKARFIDTTGFIITGDEVQYNLATGEWVAYHSGETKPYDCGPCHMTNYKDTGNQEGKPGLIGTWSFNGIQCEECHGPGELHAADPFNVAMKIDNSSEACGKCHIRGDVEQIPASGGFIRHHEQWNELFRSKHAALDCVDCHDPHVGLHPNNPDRESAIRVKCENCHLKETESFKNSGINHYGSSAGPDCVDCHMAKAAKSAVAVGPYEGDIHSHSFKINTDPNAEMFSADGSTANGYLTLEYVCLTCHSDENKSWAADHANEVHSSDLASVTSCFTCHSDQDFSFIAAQEQYDNSVHAAGENTDRNRLQASFYQACEKCHTHEGFVANVTGVPAIGDNFTAIKCFTCHAPHTSGTLALRVDSAVALANGTVFDRGDANLCASCHQSRQNASTYVTDSVTLSTHWGPHHSTQSDMLTGANAYEYSGYTYDNSPHSIVVGDGCIECHMSASFHASVGGHSWNMVNDDRGFENTSGCNKSTCHSGSIADLNRPADTDFDGDGTIEGVQDEINGMLDSLQTLLLAAGIADTTGGELEPVNGLLVPAADSAGALYNYLFVHEDRSEGIHNTDYAVGLLQSSINYLNTGNPSGIGGQPRAQIVPSH